MMGCQQIDWFIEFTSSSTEENKFLTLEVTHNQRDINEEIQY